MISARRQLVRHRRRVLDWGRDHPRILAFLERIGCMQFDRAGMARGVAIGLFIALTPTVGLQTALMLAGCLLLRGNFPAAFAVSWISNPLTLGPLYLGYYLLGEWLLLVVLKPFAALWHASMPEPVLGTVCLLVGSLLVAVPIALAGYGLSHLLARTLRARGVA